MKVATVKREQTPAERRRTAVARERVAAQMGGMLAGLDTEALFETCRAGIRALALAAKSKGEGRAVGILCGALVEIAPAYRTTNVMAAAEALFAPADQGEE